MGATTSVDYQFAWQTSMLVSQIEKCVKSAPSMRCGRNGNMNLRFQSAQPPCIDANIHTTVDTCLAEDPLVGLLYLMLLEQASNPNTNPVTEISHLHTAANAPHLPVLVWLGR